MGAGQDVKGQEGETTGVWGRGAECASEHPDAEGHPNLCLGLGEEDAVSL